MEKSILSNCNDNIKNLIDICYLWNDIDKNDNDKIKSKLLFSLLEDIAKIKNNLSNYLYELNPKLIDEMNENKNNMKIIKNKLENISKMMNSGKFYFRKSKIDNDINENENDNNKNENDNNINDNEINISEKYDKIIKMLMDENKKIKINNDKDKKELSSIINSDTLESIINDSDENQNDYNKNQNNYKEYQNDINENNDNLFNSDLPDHYNLKCNCGKQYKNYYHFNNHIKKCNLYIK